MRTNSKPQTIARHSHDSQDSDNNYSHYSKHNKNRKHTFRRHSSDVTHLTRNENNPPEQTYIDTNYKHYNTTIRRTDQGLELRTLESPPKKQKPPLPERKYKQPEPLKIEPLETITENKMTTLPPQLITPPPAYQCLGNNIPVSTTHNSPPTCHQPQVHPIYNKLQHFTEHHMNHN